jgi:hypothetical protein
MRCEDKCVDLRSDDKHCGACGNRCEKGACRKAACSSDDRDGEDGD